MVWNKGLKTGLVPKTAFKKGQVPWNKGLKLGINLKHSEFMKGKFYHTQKHSEDTKRRISESRKGKGLNNKNNKGHFGNKYRLGKQAWNKGMNKFLDNRIAKIGNRTKNRMVWNKGIPMSNSTKEKMFASLHLKPTKIEKKLISIIQKHNLPYKYVGDGSFLIGYKNPDFVNINGEKIAIEVYYKYHKEKNYGSEENYIEKRKSHFAKYGWSIIFLECERYKTEKEILNKILGGD